MVKKDLLMKHPIWILNSVLLVFVFIGLSFVLISREKPAAREDIEPSGLITPLKGEGVTINISKIYENDLFGTYRKEFPLPEAGALEPLPTPPMPKAVNIPPVPIPQFLDPLNITLRGIIVMIDDDSKNRAIIADNKTNKETTYKVGQAIEDAQLIRILNNKIIFLRSNGQQEVLYLREKDAKKDPAYILNKNWSDVIQRVNAQLYYINPEEFIGRIPDLGEFINKLDLLTVFNKGQKAGCRIGVNADSALIAALGLALDDIVVSINNIPATTKNDQIAIYKKVISMGSDEIISVKISRKGHDITIQYILKDFRPLSKNLFSNSSTVVEKQMPYEQLRKEQLESLKQRHKLAPTLDEIREKERENMMHYGRSTVIHHPKDKNE